MKPRVIIISLGILYIALVGTYILRRPAPRIRVGSAVFFIDLALSEREKEKGLGFRDSLPQDRGMLFVYDHKEQYNFWMKGMRFPLDYIWIDTDKVVDISENVPMPTTNQMPIVTPKVPVNRVLEVNAGIVQKYHIKIGDTVAVMR